MPRARAASREVELGAQTNERRLDRVFEAQRAEARQMRMRAHQIQAEVKRTRTRLADQRSALRQIARRDVLSPRQRQLLVEFRDELRRAERLLGPGASA